MQIYPAVLSTGPCSYTNHSSPLLRFFLPPRASSFVFVVVAFLRDRYKKLPSQEGHGEVRAIPGGCNNVFAQCSGRKIRTVFRSRLDLEGFRHWLAGWLAGYCEIERQPRKGLCAIMFRNRDICTGTHCRIPEIRWIAVKHVSTGVPFYNRCLEHCVLIRVALRCVRGSRQVGEFIPTAPFVTLCGKSCAPSLLRPHWKVQQKSR